MRRHRIDSSRSSAGDDCERAFGPAFTLKDEALECPKLFIENHFFSSNRGEETKEKANRAVVLHELSEAERRCLKGAAQRRGLLTISIGFRSPKWTLVIGHHIEAVCDKVEELCEEEVEQAGTSESCEQAKTTATDQSPEDLFYSLFFSQEDYERQQAEVEEAEELDVFLEQWRRQRKVNNVTVEEQHDAFLETISQRIPENGIAGEWRVESDCILNDLPESERAFDLTLGFPGPECYSSFEFFHFGFFDFGVLKGVIRMTYLDFGTVSKDWRGEATGGFIFHSTFGWRAQDTRGSLHEGEGHLSIVDDNRTQMDGVLIATSLPSSASSVSVYEFKAFQVSSDVGPYDFESWWKLRKKGTQLDCDSELYSSSEDGDSHNVPKDDSDHHCKTGSDDCPSAERRRKKRQELEVDVQNLQMELRKLVEERTSICRTLEYKLRTSYFNQAQAFHEYKHEQDILFEQHNVQSKKQAVESKKQAVEIGNLKSDLTGWSQGYDQQQFTLRRQAAEIANLKSNLTGWSQGYHQQQYILGQQAAEIANLKRALNGQYHNYQHQYNVLCQQHHIQHTEQAAEIESLKLESRGCNCHLLHRTREYA